MLPVLVALLAVAPQAAPPPKGGENKSPVTLEAGLSDPGDRGRLSFLSVRLVGAAGETAVMTERLSAAVEQTDAKAVITLRPNDRKDAKGRPIIPSVSSLGVVKLQPNEVATVTVPSSPDVLKATAAAAAGQVELTVVYEVPDAWAKRFGLTATKVSGTATAAKAQEKPPGDK